MKIIILGCNKVGVSLAENLSSEANDITVVDPDGESLRELKDRLDVGITQGWPSHPDVLRSAGADDADMIIAVTENDEVNMVACQIAYTVFKTPKKNLPPALCILYRPGKPVSQRSHSSGCGDQPRTSCFQLHQTPD